jgi:hypothetical protein
VILASDWLTLESGDLLKRLWLGDDYREETETKQLIADRVARLTPITNASGEILGRAGVGFEEAENEKELRFLGSPRWNDRIIVTVGGLRSFGAGTLAFGVFLGESEIASRQWANPLADEEAFTRWSSEQAEILACLGKTPEQLESAAKYIRMCGGNTGVLPIVRRRDGWMSADEIAEWPECPDEIWLFEAGIDVFRDVALDEQVLIATSGQLFAFPLDMHDFSYSEYPRRTAEDEEALGWWFFNEHTLSGAVVEAIARRWDTTVDEIQRVSNMPVEWRLPRLRVGERDGEEITDAGRIVRRPGRST